MTTWRLREQHLVALPHRLHPTHPRRAEIDRRHAAAIASGDVLYPDPTSGFAVFTAQFLADRGYCCLSGCRHCPYEQPDA